MRSYEDWSLAGWQAHLPGIADVRQFASELGEETIPTLAAATADRVPDRIAVSVDGKPVTHAELDDAAGRVARWPAGRGRPRGPVPPAARPSLRLRRRPPWCP